MSRLILATHNRDKLREIRALLNLPGLDIMAVDDVLPGFDVEEDQDTILGNAVKKAVETAKATGFPCLADDTGLFIEALKGAPGVMAARYAGAGCSYADNRHKALQQLSNYNNRRAEFRTVAVLAEPDGVVTWREGIVKGKITTEERGSNGFGYDAVFEVENTGKTYAEMNDEEKNACSHRGIAIRNLLPFLQKYSGKLSD